MSYGCTCLKILHGLHALEIPPTTTPSLWKTWLKVFKLSCLAVDLLWKGNSRTDMASSPAITSLCRRLPIPLAGPSLRYRVTQATSPWKGQHLDLVNPQVNSSRWSEHEAREELLWRGFDVFLMYLMQTASVLQMDMILTAKLIVYQFAFPKCNLKCLYNQHGINN